jgi:glycosyltransferase involved in cell wall biosynthesis
MLSDQHKIRVAFSVTNCICFDQRVLKIAETVSGLNCDVTIIGRRSGDCCDSGSVPFRTKRFRMIFRRGFLFYKFFNIRLFLYLVFHNYDLLVSNDLDTLLPNFLVSKIKRLPLVYDSHEYFTGVPELNNRPFVKWIWKRIERFAFPQLKNVMTVSESIASIYLKEYNIRPQVIRNFSKKADHISRYTHDELDIPENYLVLIIQGTGINIDKGAEELIEAISITDGIALLVVGSGDVVTELKQKVSFLNIGYKVRFIQSVPWEIMMKYTKSADVGMCIEKDTNLNYRYSLPNKLFDYIVAGIPVIASNLPETSKILTEHGCGIMLDEVNPEKISTLLTGLLNNKDKLDELRKKSIEASQKLNWETESQKVLEFYKDVIRTNGLRES